MKYVAVALLVLALGSQALAEPVPVDGKACQGCKTVVHIVDYLLEQGATVSLIKKYIAEFCAFVGPSYKDICVAVLDGELEQLIKWLESMTPEEVCQKLRICPRANVEDAMKCTICKLIIDSVEYFITDPHTEQEIIKLISRVCAKFPKYQTVCDQLVAYGIKELIELIKQYGDAEMVCQKIRLC